RVGSHEGQKVGDGDGRGVEVERIDGRAGRVGRARVERRVGAATYKHHPLRSAAAWLGGGRCRHDGSEGKQGEEAVRSTHGGSGLWRGAAVALGGGPGRVSSGYRVATVPGV